MQGTPRRCPRFARCAEATGAIKNSESKERCMKGMDNLRAAFDAHQIAIYFGAVIMAGLVGSLFPQAASLELLVNPALALMLFVTFLQVPLA
jgi:hypothetical protein